MGFFYFNFYGTHCTYTSTTYIKHLKVLLLLVFAGLSLLFRSMSVSSKDAAKYLSTQHLW